MNHYNKSVRTVVEIIQLGIVCLWDNKCAPRGKNFQPKFDNVYRSSRRDELNKEQNACPAIYPLQQESTKLTIGVVS